MTACLPPARGARNRCAKPCRGAARRPRRGHARRPGDRRGRGGGGGGGARASSHLVVVTRRRRRRCCAAGRRRRAPSRTLHSRSVRLSSSGLPVHERRSRSAATPSRPSIRRLIVATEFSGLASSGGASELRAAVAQSTGRRRKHTFRQAVGAASANAPGAAPTAVMAARRMAPTPALGCPPTAAIASRADSGRAPAELAVPEETRVRR